MTNTGPPEAVTGPAIQGVLSLLESATAEPRIKRVVQTSSVAAVGSVSPSGKELTEDGKSQVSPITQLRGISFKPGGLTGRLE